jgi:hypothetical protein
MANPGAQERRKGRSWTKWEKVKVKKKNKGKKKSVRSKIHVISNILQERDV